MSTHYSTKYINLKLMWSEFMPRLIGFFGEHQKQYLPWLLPVQKEAEVKVAWAEVAWGTGVWRGNIFDYCQIVH